MPAAVYPMQAKRLQSLTSVPIEHGIEAASQGWREGAPLIGVAGKLTEASADPTQAEGIALKAATGVTNTPVMYVPLNRGLVIEISVNAQVTVANMHIAYGLVETSNVWILDLTETTATFGRIVEIADDMKAVDNPRVLIVPTLAIIE